MDGSPPAGDAGSPMGAGAPPEECEARGTGGPELDLHGFRPEDTGALVREYLWASRRAGRREVRLIHGRGTGALARGVHALLARMPEVERYAFASPGCGGLGATVVRLRPGPAEGR